MSNHFKLAEAMGWRQIHDSPGNWYPPELPPLANAFGHKLPDPENDANDCNALMMAFGERNEQWSFYIHICSYGSHVVEMWMRHPSDADYHDERERHGWEGDNWMHGVCELALKVLDD